MAASRVIQGDGDAFTIQLIAEQMVSRPSVQTQQHD
jgi:hypothetical protein